MRAPRWGPPFLPAAGVPGARRPLRGFYALPASACGSGGCVRRPYLENPGALRSPPPRRGVEGGAALFKDDYVQSNKPRAVHRPPFPPPSRALPRMLAGRDAEGTQRPKGVGSPSHLLPPPGIWGSTCPVLGFSWLDPSAFPQPRSLPLSFPGSAIQLLVSFFLYFFFFLN